MKVEVIRTYDKGAFEKQIEELYREKIVENVNTSTEVLKVRGEDLIYYIAFVFYTNKVAEIDVNEKANLDKPYKDLPLPTRVIYALRNYNDKVDECWANDGRHYNRDFYDKRIDTAGDLIEAVKANKLRYMRNIGTHTIGEIKRILVEEGYAKEV